MYRFYVNITRVSSSSVMCTCIYDLQSSYTVSYIIKCVYFYSCLSRCAGVLVMLLPLFSLQWWRCQLIPSSSHSARILKNTKGQPNMRLPFSLKLLMTKMRCRDSLKVPIKVSQCIILFTFQNSRSFIYCKVLLFLCFSPKFSVSPCICFITREKHGGKGAFDEFLQNQWIRIQETDGKGFLQIVQKCIQSYTKCSVQDSYLENLFVKDWYLQQNLAETQAKCCPSYLTFRISRELIKSD